MKPNQRRHILARGAAVLAAATLGLPSRAWARREPLPGMTEGPFYPAKSWRQRNPLALDWDADLTQVRHGQQVAVARGEHLLLDLRVLDSNERPVDGVEIEIWQCDAQAAYRHPSVSAQVGELDPGFQGFGATTANAQGAARFRSIKPVAYPGRTPHIHVKLRHVSFGEWTSQLFVNGDPGNARDGLWRRLSAQGREGLAMQLQAANTEGLRWQTQHTLIVPA